MSLRKYWLLLFTFSFLVGAEEEPSAFTKKVKLSWDEVIGSSAYELEVYKSENLLVKETLQSLSWESRLEPSDYKYRVRAIDQFGRFGEWTSFEEFTIKGPEGPVELVKKSEIYKISQSSISLALSYGSYDYGSEIAGIGFGRADGAAELGVEAELGYWFTKRFLANLEVSYFSSEMSGVSIGILDFAGSLKYSLFADTALLLQPVLGLEYQGTPELLANASNAPVENKVVNTLGFGAGVDVGYQFNESWSALGWFRYIHPLSYSGGNVEKGVPDSSTFYKYGAQLDYYFNARWSLGVGASYDYRKVSYETSLGRNNLYKESTRFTLGLKTVFGKSQ